MRPQVDIEKQASELADIYEKKCIESHNKDREIMELSNKVEELEATVRHLSMDLKRLQKNEIECAEIVHDYAARCDLLKKDLKKANHYRKLWKLVAKDQ
jgi:hypothetical protein